MITLTLQSIHAHTYTSIFHHRVKFHSMHNKYELFTIQYVMWDFTCIQKPTEAS